MSKYLNKRAGEVIKCLTSEDQEVMNDYIQLRIKDARVEIEWVELWGARLPAALAVVVVAIVIAVTTSCVAQVDIGKKAQYRINRLETAVADCALAERER